MKLFILTLLSAFSVASSTWAAPTETQANQEEQYLVEVTAPDGKVTLYNQDGEIVTLSTQTAAAEATVQTAQLSGSETSLLQNVNCGGGCGGCGPCGGGCGCEVEIMPLPSCGGGCATPYYDGYGYGGNYYGPVATPYYNGGYGYRTYGYGGAYGGGVGGARRPVYGRPDYGAPGRPVGRPGWGR